MGKAEKPGERACDGENEIEAVFMYVCACVCLHQFVCKQ